MTSRTALLYTRIICPKLPEEAARHLRPRLEPAFEGLQIPRHSERQERFLEPLQTLADSLMDSSFARIRRYHAMNAPSVVLVGEGNILHSKIETLKAAATLASRSHRPDAYLQFLARKGLELPFFLRVTPFFLDRTSVELSEVPEASCKEAQEVVDLVKDGSPDALKALINKMVEGLNIKPRARTLAYSIVAMLTGKFDAVGMLLQEDRLLPADIKSSIKAEGAEAMLTTMDSFEVKRMVEQHFEGLHVHTDAEGRISGVAVVQKRFETAVVTGHLLEPEDLRLLAGRNLRGVAPYLPNDAKPQIVLATERDMTVQHELQHVLDRLAGIAMGQVLSEYCAYLGGIVFSEDPVSSYRKLEQETGSAKEQLYRVIFRQEPEPPRNRVSEFPHHDDAKRRILREMQKVLPRQVAEKAMQLLNAVYKAACGLTYDQILKPFMAQKQE